MAADTRSNFQVLLKTIWPQKQIYDMLNYGMPFFALLRKDTNLANLNNLAAGYGTTQGVGSSFPDAKANKQPESNAGFSFGPSQIYSIASVDRQLIRLSRGDARAIIGALDRTAQQAILAWKFECATQLWGNGGGSIGKVLSVSGANLLLTNVDDVVKFDRRMTVQSAPDDGTAATGGPTAVRPGSVVVGAINRQVSATVFHLKTTTGNWTDPGNIPGLVAGDYLFRGGNYVNVMNGEGAWLPAADPTAGDNFGGQDRSLDPLRLSGIKLDATGRTPREAAMFVVQESLRNSASPTHYFLNPTNFGNLQLELQQAGLQIVTKEAAAPIGTHVFGEPIDGIGFIGTRGQVKVYPDDRITSGVGHALQLDTWYISGGGEFPSLVAEDGLTIVREEWADSFELRVVGDLNLFCTAPGLNTRALISV
jgi:hypothetical protein